MDNWIDEHFNQVKEATKKQFHNDLLKRFPPILSIEPYYLPFIWLAILVSWRIIIIRRIPVVREVITLIEHVLLCVFILIFYILK